MKRGNKSLSHRDVARGYDKVYGRGLTTPPENLLMSLDKLFLNYQVLEPLSHRDSDMLPIALRFLDFENLQDKIILDYGCGSAKSSVVFAQQGATVFGFDLSVKSIMLGKRRVLVNDVDPRVHLTVMAAHQLGFAENSFDYVFGYQILYYLHTKVRFASEILRVLKPGGTAIFCEALDGNSILRLVRKALRYTTGTIKRTGGAALTENQIQDTFGRKGQLRIYPVNLLGIFRRLFHNRTNISTRTVRFLTGLDRWLFTRFPSFRQCCGEVVIVIRK